MKRTLVLTILALFGLSAAHAQQQFATLQHGDSISVYYGRNALNQANDAASNGDIITLSPGIFEHCSLLDKPLTIRGAGMMADSILKISGTYVVGNETHINIPYDSNNVLSVEGIHFSLNNIYFLQSSSPVFSKCYFEKFSNHPADYSKDVNMTNPTFINCIINQWSNRFGNNSSSNNRWKLENCIFSNCVIFNMPNHSTYNCTLMNCIVGVDSPVYLNAQQMTNCIAFSINGGTPCSGLYANYCMGLQPTNTFFATNERHNVSRVIQSNGFSLIFKQFNGTYEDGMSFELQDSIASTILGSDGTQVGVYGGQFPFNPRVLNYSATVASQSRPDGKLEVTIRPIND